MPDKQALFFQELKNHPGASCKYEYPSEWWIEETAFNVIMILGFDDGIIDGYRNKELELSWKRVGKF